MLEAWLDLPLAVRLLAVAAAGIVVGAAANWAIYSCAYFPRPISPWRSDLPPELPPRRRSDRLPLLGWWGLRRESTVHGRGFWVRPLLIELSMGAGLAALYLHVTELGMPLAPPLRDAEPLAFYQPWMHWLFLNMAVLVPLMVVATFIDFDERTIPDAITIPGTMIALGLATASLQTRLPFLNFFDAAPRLEPLLLSTPHRWHDDWHASYGLWVALAIWAGWCFALANRRVILRRGVGKAIQYFCVGLVRRTRWQLLLGIWLLGTVAVALVWGAGGAWWAGLLTGLVGMAVGGGAVWAVRLVAGAAMGQEAMGFGDVTLMAMIGAFLGWQPALLAFFLAPMTAIAIVLVQWAVTGERVVAFGPYLCAGALVTVLGWNAIWTAVSLHFYELGPQLLALILIFSLLLLGGLLFVWRWLREALLSP